MILNYSAVPASSLREVFSRRNGTKWNFWGAKNVKHNSKSPLGVSLRRQRCDSRCLFFNVKLVFVFNKSHIVITRIASLRGPWHKYMIKIIYFIILLDSRLWTLGPLLILRFKNQDRTIMSLKKSIDCLIQHTIFSTIQHQQNVVN